MNVATKISEAIAQKREHQTAIDNLDVRITQLVAGIPAPVDHSVLLEEMTDEVRSLQGRIESQRSEIDSIRRSMKEISEELDNSETDCETLVDMIKKMQAPRSDPAA
jgi:septal ring factor EnvC (AmiA/AmiB activator)